MVLRGGAPSGKLADASSSASDASTSSSFASATLGGMPLKKACKRMKQTTRKERILQTPLPATFAVDNLRLRPTKDFNLLWYWLAERQDIYVRRRQGLPREKWTDDPIMQTNWFCNAYRILDRESQFLVREVIEKGPQTPEEIMFRVLLYDIFTRRTTYELLERHLGPLTWKTYNRARYLEVLDNRPALYTSAFQKTSGDRRHAKLLHAHLDDLEMFMRDGVGRRLPAVAHAADVFDFFFWHRGYAEFKAYQLALNLSYTPLFNFHADDYVVPGPGARAGLRRMFGASLDAAARADPAAHMRALLWMARTQDEHFARLGLRFARLEGRPLEVPDIEHAVCELEKYARGGANRKYKAPAGCPPALPAPVLPKAWAHPARATPKVRAEWPNTSRESKGYFVDNVVGDKMEDGQMFVLVKWTGYAEHENTWEPASLMWHDAPNAMQEYFGKKGGMASKGKKKR
ncbi:hypothetical protein HDZ31DRAFT_84804 [Schizophyllum fasciatum]